LYSPVRTVQPGGHKVQCQASPSAASGAICRRGPFSLQLSFGQAKESGEQKDKQHAYRDGQFLI